jgi:ribosomal-protein-alanine N-acetyltransferase
VISLTLQPLTDPLLPAAVELDRQCFGQLWSLEGYRREIESPNSELLALVGQEEAEAKEGSVQSPPQPLLALGCYWAIADEAHITILAVDPTYQRQGLGQAMLVVLLTSARQRDLQWATLEVRISNQSALYLYKKFGFQEAGRRKRYYQDTGEDALVLWLGGLQSNAFSQSLNIWQQQVNDRLFHWGWRIGKKG